MFSVKISQLSHTITKNKCMQNNWKTFSILKFVTVQQKLIKNSSDLKMVPRVSLTCSRWNWFLLCLYITHYSNNQMKNRFTYDTTTHTLSLSVCLKHTLSLLHAHTHFISLSVLRTLSLSHTHTTGSASEKHGKKTEIILFF